MTATAPGVVRRTFSSLAVRNYRLYFGGQIVSLAGSWVQQTAQMWLVLNLTGSGVAVGVTASLQSLPMLVLGVLGGALADRYDKRKLLLLTQVIQGALAAGLAALTLTGTVHVWMVFAFAGALGCVKSVDNPTRQSFAAELVSVEKVANAVALNTATVTTAKVLGPAMAGILIAAIGTGWCFALNAASFVAVLLALLTIRPGELYRAAARPARRARVLGGLSFALRSPDLRAPLAAMVVAGVLAFNMNVLLPLIASGTFHGDSRTYGLLFSVMGGGSLVGALLSAYRERPTRALIVGSVALFGVLLLAAAVAPTTLTEAAVMLPLGAAMITFQVTGNSWLQVNAPAEIRGQVVALYVILFTGTTALGGPLTGFVAGTYGPRVALGVAGAGALIAGLIATILFGLSKMNTVARGVARDTS